MKSTQKNRIASQISYQQQVNGEGKALAISKGLKCDSDVAGYVTISPFVGEIPRFMNLTFWGFDSTDKCSHQCPSGHCH